MNAIPGNFPCAPARWITTSCVSLRSWKLCIERRNREHLLSWNNKQIYVQPSGSANFIFTSRSPPYRLINMNATQKPGRKVFQKRFWIRINLLKRLIFLASPRVPRRSNRSFSRFPLMELTSSVRRACVRDDGKFENKALRLGCLIQGEKHLRLIYLNRSLNFSTSFSTRASLSTETQVVSGVVRWQKKNNATTECRMILSDMKATQWENVASPWSFVPTIKVKSLSLLSDSGAWLLCFRRRQQNTPPHYWCHNRVKQAIKLKPSQASRMNA